MIVSLRFDNASSLATGGFDFFASDEGYNASRLRIQNNGNVGIGTTAPAYKLDVNGSVRGDIYYDSSSVSYYLDPANAGTSLNTAGDIVIAAGAGNWTSGLSTLRTPSTVKNTPLTYPQ